jgi:hypothetical protein
MSIVTVPIGATAYVLVSEFAAVSVLAMVMVMMMSLSFA